MMIPSVREEILMDSPRRDGHELVQDHELQLQFNYVAEGLDGMADARLVEVDQDDGQQIEADGDDVDVDEVRHDAAVSDAGFEVQELGQGPDVDAAEDAFGDGEAELGDAIDYGFSEGEAGGDVWVVGVVCLPG